MVGSISTTVFNVLSLNMDFLYVITMLHYLILGSTYGNQGNSGFLS